MKRYLTFTLLLASIWCASPVHAQIPTTADSLDLSASTDNPIPGQTVTLTARSYSIEISAATVVWSVNGVVAKKGIGLTTFDIQAPALGKTISVDVTATSPEGRRLNNSIRVSSGSIDLIVETDGYVPPLFKGKIPISYQNTVRIIAIPHIADSSGKEYDPKDLIYTWQRTDRVIEDQSGYGKQVLSVAGDLIPRPYTIKVAVQARDGSGKAERIITIGATAPSIGFYKNDPLYGALFNQAIGSVISLGAARETGVLMVPFGFTKPENSLGDLSLSWMINGAQHSELSSNQSIVLRAPDGQFGASTVQLTVTNQTKILQRATGGFSSVFGAQKDSSTQQVTF